MDYNPYAAPQAPGMMPAGPAQTGQPQPWAAGEVVGHSWEMFKRFWVVLVFAPLLAQIIAGVPAQIVQLSGHSNPQELSAAGVIGQLISTIIGVFFLGGLTKIYLAAAQGIEPQFGDMFTGGSVFLPLLGASFLMGFAVAFGFVMLLVPGIILWLGFSMAQYYVVDAKMGAIESIKRSWEVTTGHKGALFVLGMACVGIMLVGFAACCLGVLAAAPIIQVAWATVYLRITGRGAAMMGGMGMPMPGGYAPDPMAAGFGRPVGPPPGGGAFGPPPGFPGPGGPGGPAGPGGFGGPVGPGGPAGSGGSGGSGEPGGFDGSGGGAGGGGWGPPA